MNEILVAFSRMSAKYGIELAMPEDILQKFSAYMAFYNYEPDLYIEAVITFFIREHKLTDITPDEFLNSAYRPLYHVFLDMMHKGDAEKIIPYIGYSAIKLKKFMNENNFQSFDKYINFNLEIYPIFLNHIRNGKFNYFILTYADSDDTVLNKIQKDIRETFLMPYITLKDGMRIKTAMNPMLETSLVKVMKYLNEEKKC